MQLKNQVSDFFKKFTSKKTFIELIENDLETLEKEEESQSLIKKSELPLDLRLRDSNFFRKFYETAFPVSHLFRISYKYNREYLDKFMPLSQEQYIGRGNYKFVFQLPWQQVVKVGISKLPSDYLFTTLFEKVSKQKEQYLKNEEMQLCNFLKSKTNSISKREKIDFKFTRLGLERLFYWKIKVLIPDLVLPTRFFMGLRVRQTPLGINSLTLTPCDNQSLLIGKHLKEFMEIGKESKKDFLKGLFPKWKISFDTHKFGEVKKSQLKKIAFDFHRIIEATKYIAKNENMIFDIHTENVIITLPNFELKIFDYHLFDKDIYHLANETSFSEKNHIAIIEQFIESFQL